MKKLVYSLAVLFSVAMVSCGGNKAAEATDSETVAVEETVEVVADSNDTTVAVEVAEAPVAESAAVAE